jgi:programmed cell death protein 5
MSDEEKDAELEEIRRRKMRELQMQQQQQQAYVEQANAVEQQKQTILRQILDPDAKSRLTRLKLAYPEVAHSVEEQLILLAQSGRLKKIITDEDLKTILTKVQPQKREITITRR